jgi:hypothetical protein
MWTRVWNRMALRLPLPFETAEAVAEEGVVKCSVGGERIRDCERFFCWSISRTTSAHIRPTPKYLDVDLPLPGLVPSIPVCYREKATSRSPLARHALSPFASEHPVTRGRLPDAKTNSPNRRSIPTHAAIPRQRRCHDRPAEPHDLPATHSAEPRACTQRRSRAAPAARTSDRLPRAGHVLNTRSVRVHIR